MNFCLEVGFSWITPLPAGSDNHPRKAHVNRHKCLRLQEAGHWLVEAFCVLPPIPPVAGLEDLFNYLCILYHGDYFHFSRTLGTDQRVNPAGAG